MSDITALPYLLLCTDLGLVPENVPATLKQLLEAKLAAAWKELEAAGLHLTDSNVEDVELQVLYAAWLYRARVKQQEKPVMLQRLLHNRQVARATKSDPMEAIPDDL